jgi:hypothetical protein
MAYDQRRSFEGEPVPITPPTVFTFDPATDPHSTRGYTWSTTGSGGYVLDFGLTTGTSPILDWRNAPNPHHANGWHLPPKPECKCIRGYHWHLSEVAQPIDEENRGLASDAAGRQCSQCDRHIPGQWGGRLELLSMNGGICSQGDLQGGSSPDQLASEGVQQLHHGRRSVKS